MRLGDLGSYNSLVDALLSPSNLAVWAKGHEVPGYDPREWRKDDFGNFIKWSDHGDRSSPYGWERDHIHPKSRGGSDVLANLRPLHHKANSTLGGLLGSLGNAYQR